MDIKAIGTALGDFSDLVEHVNGFFKHLVPAYGELNGLSAALLFGSL
ncbi:hypothetical protein CCANI_12370 [Corynebacterium canis]|nr:hypothetical protein [Corynebacterium canis]WJY76280.1 hypothetical protein CCANI_12370 [Corynebacterium canis]